MAGFQQVIVCGRLGRDPEVKSFQNGGKICNLSVATSEKWKDKNSGEMKERTEWHRISILAEGAANVAEKYLRKGSEVHIVGKLETRKWQDQQGNDKYTTEIVVRPYGGGITLIGGRSNGEGGGGSSGGSYSGNSGGGQSSGGGYSGGGGGGSADLDDEIPF